MKLKRSSKPVSEAANLVPVISSPPHLGEVIEAFAKFPAGFVARGSEVNQHKKRALLVKVKRHSR